MTLPHLFSITRDSPEYNERDRAGVLYAQSWLLTHMLMLDPKYGLRFGDFLGKLSTGISGERALEDIYGKGAAEVQKDLRAYYRSPTLAASAITPA